MHFRYFSFAVLSFFLTTGCRRSETFVSIPPSSPKTSAPQKNLEGWSAELRSALQGGLLASTIPTDPQGRYRLLLEVKKGQPFPKTAGLFRYANVGRIYSVRATKDALRRLQGHPAIQRLTPTVRYKVRRAMGGASLVTHASELNPNGDPITYKLTVPAAGKVTILVVGDGQADQAAWTPSVEICSDASCGTVLDSDFPSFANTGNNDPHPQPKARAQLAHTFAQPGSLYIKIATKDNNIGKFSLLIASNDIELTASQLTEGDTNNKAPRRAGMSAGTLRKDQNIDGTGVIVAVIDSGIDWCHTDFVRQGKSQVLFLWDQGLTAQGNEQSPDPGVVGQAGYGVEYTQQDLNAALPTCDRSAIRSQDISGHGTHVAGIAAGGGNNPGIAPGADLIIIKGLQDLVSSVKYILSKAKTLNRPVAINMSLGGHSGAHDGTNLSDKMLEQVIGPGVNIQVAASNEGDKAIHATKTLNANENGTLRLEIVPPGPSDDPLNVNFFTDKDDTFSIEFSVAGQTENLTWGQTKQGNNSVFDFEWGAGQAYAENPKLLRSFLSIRWKNATQQKETLTWKITKTGGSGSGTFHAYDTSEKGTFLDYVPKHPDGSIQGTLASPGTSRGANSVGASNLHGAFDFDNGNFFASQLLVPAAVASFSSRGPTRDGRPGVTFLTPGHFIESTMTGYILECKQDPNKKDCSDLLPRYTLDKTYISEGTSMATPMATGAAALILQKDPTAFVRPLFQRTAQQALWETNPPETIWGAGLVRLPEAFQVWQSADAPQVKLETTDGKTEGGAPFRVTLKVTPQNNAVLKEFFWNFDEMSGNEAIGTTPTQEFTLEQPGERTISVVVVAESGRTTVASIKLRATNDPPAEQTPEQTAEQSAEQAPEQTPEQAAEQAPEQAAEQTNDAAEEKAPEQEPEQAAEQAPEQAAEQAAEQANDATPKGGCGCNSTQQGSPLEMLFLLCCLLALFHRARRHTAA